MPRTLKFGEPTARLNHRLPLSFFDRLDRVVEVVGGARQEVLMAALDLHGAEDMHAQALKARMELRDLERCYREQMIVAQKERRRLQEVQKKLTEKVGRYCKLAAIARGRKNLQQMEDYIARVEGLRKQSADIEAQLAALAIGARPERFAEAPRSSVSQVAGA